jgi:hypothetical protein
MSATRRVAAVTAVAIALLVAPMGAGTPASGLEPLDCQATVPGVTARGLPTTFRYDDGRTSSQRRGPDTLGYQPRDIAFAHRSTSLKLSATTRSYWFTLSGQQLREVIETNKRDAQGRLLSTDYRTRLVKKGWSARQRGPAAALPLQRQGRQRLAPA